MEAPKEPATARRTYAREFASLLMIFLCGLFVWGAGWDNAAATKAGEFLSLPIFSYFFTIFGGEKAAQLGGLSSLIRKDRP